MTDLEIHGFFHPCGQALDDAADPCHIHPVRTAQLLPEPFDINAQHLSTALQVSELHLGSMHVRYGIHDVVRLVNDDHAALQLDSQRISSTFLQEERVWKSDDLSPRQSCPRGIVRAHIKGLAQLM